MFLITSLAFAKYLVNTSFGFKIAISYPMSKFLWQFLGFLECKKDESAHEDEAQGSYIRGCLVTR